MPSRSPYPAFEVPDNDLWGFLFERPNLPFPPRDRVLLSSTETTRTYTYAQIQAAAEDFGKGLRASWDWRKNDVLALFNSNSIDIAPVLWGCHWAGGVLKPANPG